MTCTRGCCASPQEHYRSIAFGASTTPNRRPEAVEITARDRRWDRDMPAYKRLRQNGLQPPTIDGCAELESKATEDMQVTMGTPNADPKKVREGMSLSKDLGYVT